MKDLMKEIKKASPIPPPFKVTVLNTPENYGQLINEGFEYWDNMSTAAEKPFITINVFLKKFWKTHTKGKML
jgi:hypothetical protein